MAIFNNLRRAFLLAQGESPPQARDESSAADEPKVPNDTGVLSEQIDRLLSAIDDVSRDRAAADETIKKSNEEREQLLLDPDTDAAIERIERTIARAELRLERLSRIEPLLLQQVASLQAEVQRAAFDALIDHWRQAVLAYCASLRETIERRSVLVDLRAQASAQSLHAALAFLELPYLDIAGGPDFFEYRTLQTLAAARPAPASPGVHVRFRQRCGMYLRDDVAFFPEEVASQYVVSGMAEAEAVNTRAKEH